MVNPITDEELARLEELHAAATREHGDGTKHLTHSHTVTREFAHAMYHAFQALRERLRLAEEENERLNADSAKLAWAWNEVQSETASEAADKARLLSAAHACMNSLAWLADRDAKTKALGAAEWLEANNERLDTMNHADVAMQAAAMRERAR